MFKHIFFNGENPYFGWFTPAFSMASIMLNHQFSWLNPTCSMVFPWFFHGFSMGFSMIKTGQSPPFLVIPGHPRRPRHRRLVAPALLPSADERRSREERRGARKPSRRKLSTASCGRRTVVVNCGE